MKASRQEADERHLIQAAQRDPSLFAELYEDNFDRVYAYIVRRVRDRYEAEDLTSEVFQQALTGLPRFEWRGVPFVAWLYRIAAHAIADRARRLAREQADPADPAPDYPDEAAAKEVEERALLFGLVNRLPADQRAVILQRFVEQRSIREIAQELRRTEGAVKQLQFRALKNLRARMGYEK